MVGRRLLFVAVAVVVVAACGGTSRGDFDAEIESRGGGLGADLPLAAVAALEDEVGADVALRSMSVNRALVTMEVLVPGTDDQLDRYSYGTSGLYGGEGLSDPIPVSGVGDPAALRRALFRPQRIALADLDAIVDDAIARADLEGGYAQSVYIDRSTGERATIAVNVTSPRDNVQVRYLGDGRPVPGPPA